MTSPDTIGSYNILQELGAGGFATVYLATKESNEVALKVLNPVHARTNQIKRFEREAQTIKELKHRNIIRIFETGRIEETAFIAMEYIPDGNLRKRIDDNISLSRNQAVDILKGISDALTHAHTHKKKIIHRDLKPENILLKDNEDVVQPVLTDFGTVKFLSGNNETVLTESGHTLGSFCYISPEQCNNGQLTPMSDLYSLAIIFFEMLAGRRPFEGSSYFELITQHSDGRRPRLSEVAPHVGSIFDDILIKAMAVNAYDRYQSVAEFFEAINEANVQADRIERVQQKRHKQVSTMIEAADIYLRQDQYDPDKALAIIDAALDVDPRYTDALLYKGRIHFERKQYSESLEAYQQAFELNPDPESEVGIEYLDALRKVAEVSWREDRTQAIEYYHQIVEILGENDRVDEGVQEIWKQVQPKLARFHQSVGDKTYAQGSPQYLEQAIETLTYHIDWLNRIKADCEGLNYKKRQLQVKQYTDLIQIEENNIAALNIEEISPTEKDKISTLAQSYLNINNYYQELLELRPEDKFDWEQKRCQKLKEHALLRLQLAQRAATDGDFEAAIQHYRGIDDIKRIDYPSDCEELGIDVEQEIQRLEEQADYANKYTAIINLIIDGELPVALDSLERNFIDKGDFEYRNVARLLWRLICAKQQGWNVTSDWIIEPIIEVPEAKPQSTPGAKNNAGKMLQSNLTLTVIQLGIIILSILIGALSGIIIGYFIFS